MQEVELQRKRLLIIHDGKPIERLYAMGHRGESLGVAPRANRKVGRMEGKHRNGIIGIAVAPSARGVGIIDGKNLNGPHTATRGPRHKLL